MQRPRPVESKDASRTKRYESLKEQYPMIFAFGEDIEYLSHDEAIAAPVEARIKSVWPFLVRQVLRFSETLRPRDRANYDPEDVLGELWVTLVEKDEKWEPTRGRYLTFAGRVVANELHAIRDRSHTVHSPKNTGCRIKQYEAEADEGGMSERRRKTYADILRVLGEQEAIADDPMSMSAPDTADVVERRERQGIARQAVKLAVDVLTPCESKTLGQAFGLFGQVEIPIEQIAEESGRRLDRVKKTKARAQAKLRERLEELGHPFADE